MSLNAIFGKQSDRLERIDWKNPEVRRLAQEIAAILSDRSTIKLDGPIVLENNGTGPAIKVLDTGGSQQAVQIVNATGQQAIVGIGINSEGLVANDVLFRSEYIVSTEASSNGYAIRGSSGKAGTGVPGRKVRFKPIAGLLSLLGWDRKHSYPLGSVVSVEITAIRDDYLVGTIVGTSTEIQVSKPWVLCRTPWDGETINGVEYTYSDSQNRTATLDENDELQEVTWPYEIGNIIQAQRVSNSTGYATGIEEDEQWVDLNVDARIWAASDFTYGTENEWPVY